MLIIAAGEITVRSNALQLWSKILVPARASDSCRFLEKGDVLMRPVLAILTAVSLCLGSGAVLAAKSKCDYDRAKDKDKGFERAKNAKGKTLKGFYIDKFTDELVVETTWNAIGGGNTEGSVATRTRGNNSFLQLAIAHRWSKKTFPTDDETQSNFSIPPDGKLLIGMADGSVLTLHATDGAEAKTSYETPKPRSGKPFWIMSNATVEYVLDADSQAALIATEARALRVMTDSENLDIRIEGRDHDWVIQNAVRCLAAGAK